MTAALAPDPHARGGRGGLTRTEGEQELARRRRVLDWHPFGSKQERKIYALWSEGFTQPQIAKQVRPRVSQPTIHRILRRVDDAFDDGAPVRLDILAKQCDRGMLALVLQLIRRALDRPDEMRGYLERMEDAAELAKDFDAAREKLRKAAP